MNKPLRMTCTTITSSPVLAYAGQGPPRLWEQLVASGDILRVGEAAVASPALRTPPDMTEGHLRLPSRGYSSAFNAGWGTHVESHPQIKKL